jgi:hypothetical protein
MSRWAVRLRTLAVTILVAAVPVTAAAQSAPTVDDAIARMAADPRTPDAYSADVKLHVKLRVFPFISITLHGNTTYKRPGLYHFVFRGVPKVAEKFDDLRYDLGNPLAWRDRYEIAWAPASTPEAPVLRLTPKTAGGMVAHLDVTTDAQSGRLLKAVWARHDGGKITLVQTYAVVGNTDLVSHQSANIDIPHMRAELTADYAGFTVETSTVAGYNAP